MGKQDLLNRLCATLLDNFSVLSPHLISHTSSENSQAAQRGYTQGNEPLKRHLAEALRLLL